MKVLTSELKSFRKNSSSIRPKNIIPVLSYLKFSKDGHVTKNNLTEFVTQKISCDEDMLIDEKILMSFVDQTTKPEIQIKKVKNQVVISDGETEDMCPTEDITHFPASPKPDEEFIPLGYETVSAIGTASNFIIDSHILTAMNMVLVGRGFVVGQNGAIGYAEKASKDLPEICLYKEILNAIKRFQDVGFSQNDSYYFFEAEDCVYGFSKPELRFTDCTRIGKADVSALPKFSVDRKELKRFNDHCISSSVSILKQASFEMNGGLNVSMIDPDRERNVARKIPATGNGSGKMFYNPEMMNILLKNVVDDTLTFHQGENHCYITAESGFQSLLMAIDPNQ